eukprot:TRINITY_DN62944_c0_g1_i1.p1 TRINITY_DN62944_c0_g1~~TRINITY_DN62944_c0_g1_i1.p1  ORF type:complete len:410 (-),score=65.88 TRINITY_DN62944_c0_g1_i1:108-1337(-)
MSPRLVAMDGPRWLASVFIVMSHYYVDKSTFSHVLACRWGCMWTQFFFILSGFVLAYQEMVRDPKSSASNLSQLEYLKRRLVPIFPAYLFSIGLVFATKTPRLFEWKAFPLSLLLMQSWFPIWYDTEGMPFSEDVQYFPVESWNAKTWFLSVLVIFWLLLRPMVKVVRGLSLTKAWVLGLLLWMWSVVPGHIWQLVDLDSKFSRVAWMCFAYGPAGYIHVFAVGVVTARIFILSAVSEKFEELTPHDAPGFMRCGVFLGYALFYYLVNNLPHTGFPSAYFMTMHNGGFMPVFFLIITGSALGVDPLAKYLFQSRIFQFLGRISYSQYLLQSPIWTLAGHLWGHDTLARKLYFPALLTVAAYLTEAYVVAPCNALLRSPSSVPRRVKKTDDVTDVLIEKCVSYGGVSQKV